MNPFVLWLTDLLSKVIRPIIRDEIKELKELYFRHEEFKEYDRKNKELAEEMAKASTSEERWAILQKIRDNRARFGN